MKSKPTFNRFFTAIGEVLDAASEAAAAAAAERLAEDIEKQKIIDMVNDWNLEHPRNLITLPTEAPKPVRCTTYRLVEDCKDIDCSIHYYEKKRIRDAKARESRSL